MLPFRTKTVRFFCRNVKPKEVQSFVILGMKNIATKAKLTNHLKNVFHQANAKYFPTDHHPFAGIGTSALKNLTRECDRYF